jgi:hypothetical protein
LKDKIIKIERLWNGLVSVRDYVLIGCIEKKRNVVFLVEDEKMTVKWAYLSSLGFWTSQVEHISRFSGKTYKLVDFRFKKDQPESNQEELL